MQVYFDNAATTPMDKEVLQAMLPYMEKHYGNPSSIHTHGRETRSAIEIARRKIAQLLNTSPSEIFFTSGGTEADNLAIRCSIDTLDIKHAISSPLEHHAVLHTLEYYQKLGKVQVHLLRVDPKGNLDLAHLEELLNKYPKSFVSLMHANNEIGNLYDLQAIGALCREKEAILHSDTVQTIGHFPIDLQNLSVDFIVGAAHKFHGPKGVGFIYINADNNIHPLIHGGAQERNMRGGTENLYGIIGMAKALELAQERMEPDKAYISELKQYFIDQLKRQIPGVAFNGECEDLSKSLYTVLSISLPPSESNDMIVFNLDINKISASAGSACSSGSDVGSHVLRCLNFPANRAAVRFSFSRHNTRQEVDYVLDKLSTWYQKKGVSASSL